MLTAEEQKIVAAVTQAIVGVVRLNRYTSPSMLKVPKATALAFITDLTSNVPIDHSVGSPTFIRWRTTAILHLGTIFGDESPIADQFRNVNFEDDVPIAGGGGTDYARKKYLEGCEEASAILRAAAKRIHVQPDEPPHHSPAGGHAKPSGYTMIHVSKAEAIKLLTTAAESVPKDKDWESEIFHDWFDRTLGDVLVIFGEDSDEARRFDEISFQPTGKFYVRMSGLGRGRTIDDEKALRIRQAYYSGCQKAETKLREWIDLVGKQPDVPPNPAPPAKNNSHGEVAKMHGQRLRANYEMIVRENGKPVIIHKGYDSPNHSEQRIEKAAMGEHGGAFLFIEMVDVKPGDIIQQVGSTIF
jgi:hypothetical protein